MIAGSTHLLIPQIVTGVENVPGIALDIRSPEPVGQMDTPIEGYSVGSR